MNTGIPCSKVLRVSRCRQGSSASSTGACGRATATRPVQGKEHVPDRSHRPRPCSQLTAGKETGTLWALPRTGMHIIRTQARYPHVTDRGMEIQREGPRAGRPKGTQLAGGENAGVWGTTAWDRETPHPSSPLLREDETHHPPPHADSLQCGLTHMWAATAPRCQTPALPPTPLPPAGSSPLSSRTGSGRRHLASGPRVTVGGEPGECGSERTCQINHI